MADMQFEKFDPGTEIGQTDDVVIEESGQPVGNQDTLEAALGLEGETQFEAPEDPAVAGFMDVVDGKPQPQEPKTEGNDPQIAELIEANKRLASQLGRQGNEVVGPLRQQLETAQAQIQALQAQMAAGGGNVSQGQMVDDTIRNLYGPQADVSDEAYRAHAMAHINAGNRLGQAVEEQYIRPLQAEIEKLNGKLAEAQANAGLPGNEQQEALLEQYPSLRDLSPVERASVLKDLVRNRPAPPPTPRMMEPGQYVEPTMPSAPVKPSEKAQLEAFDSLDTDQQGAALGQMLARRGMRSLGR